MLPSLPFLPPTVPSVATSLPFLAAIVPLLPPSRTRQSRQIRLKSGISVENAPAHHRKVAKTAMFTAPVNIATHPCRSWIAHP